MVISILKYLFFNLYCQLQVVNRFKYGKMEIHRYNRDLNTHLRLGEMVYSNMQCNISNTDKQKYISHMYAIDVYD